jgi:hypothetical protein
VLAFGQLGDVVAGIVQGAQLAATGQRDALVEGAMPLIGRHLVAERAAPFGPRRHVKGPAMRWPAAPT